MEQPAKSTTTKPKSKYQMCPDCEACFKLPPGGCFPKHTFLNKRCDQSDKPAPTEGA